MTTKRSKATNGNETKARPTHTVYQVIEQKDGNKFWNPVGAAWPHKDGKGFNLRLDAVPVPFDGTLTVRERKNNQGEGQ